MSDVPSRAVGIGRPPPPDGGAPPAEAPGSLLGGRRVLVVEDEFFVALDLKERLLEAGATVVGPVPSVADCALLIAVTRIDAAVLDINLGGETVYPVADVLIAAGVPVVFVTGYARGDLPERFRDVPRQEKPFDMGRVERALAGALGMA